MCNYYVYAHYKVSDNTLFYIGKGKGNRANSSRGRSTLWKRIVSKHGFRSELLVSNLEEPDAFIQEILAIKEFSPICNFTKGGQGVSGFRQSQEQIKNRIYKNGIHIRMGKKLSSAHLHKLHAGRDFAFKTGAVKHAKKLMCYISGKSWTSISSCALDLGIKASTLAAKLRGQNKNNTTIRYTNKGGC